MRIPRWTIAGVCFAAALLQPGGSAFGAGSDMPPGAVVYGVVPPLFDSDHPLRGVTRRLPKLAELGVDVIWLSPIGSTDDPSHISFSITDYFGIRSDFGTAADLRELVRTAHRLGMKVILDVVPNHTSVAHPYFKAGKRDGKPSPYYDYYERDRRGRAEYYFDWKHLPNLNYRNPAVRSMTVRAFRYWIREFGIDGFRVDAAWGIRERAPNFWKDLEREISRLDPDVILLAEASARDPYYARNGFDLAYDWTDELGRWAWEGVFDDVEKIGPRLHAALTASSKVPGQVLRFLGNNDTGKRFASRYGIAMQRVAAVLEFTVPGIPVIYTGDEVAAEFDPHEDPPPIAWNGAADLRPLYSRLAALRETLSALQTSFWTPAPVVDNASAYAYFRSDRDGGWVLIVLNFGPAANLRVEVPAAFAKRVASAAHMEDALTNQPVPLEFSEAGRTLKIDMKKQDAVILVPGAL